MYRYARDIIELCHDRQVPISAIVIENEMRLSELTEAEVRQRLEELYQVMQDSCHRTLETAVPSVSGLTGGDAKRLWAYLGQTIPLCGDTLLKGVSYALSCFEINTSMGCIVAAPTAGSCGILPGSVIAVSEALGSPKQAVIDALATSSGIGQIITTNATISGAEGGCQAECGSAAAMAAGAIVQLRGGTVEQCFHAAAMALKNVMGLVCDPIAGLVEIPCAKRNASGVANALLCADLALAGITSFVPFDEVVEAMGQVGKQLPYQLKETALGGLAATPTGKRVKEQVLGRPLNP